MFLVECNLLEGKTFHDGPFPKCEQFSESDIIKVSFTAMNYVYLDASSQKC